MELSLRLDTLGIAEVHYLRGRERYRDWPPFLLLAASRQARILAYMTHDAAELLHQQVLAEGEAAGVDGVREEGGEGQPQGEEGADGRQGSIPKEREKLRV